MEKGTTAVIKCNLIPMHSYPEWRGQPRINGVLRLYNIEGESTFFTSLENYARLSWAANNKDLVLNDVVREDEGMYQCYSYGIRWTVLLNIRGRSLTILMKTNVCSSSNPLFPKRNHTHSLNPKH